MQPLALQQHCGRLMALVQYGKPRCNVEIAHDLYVLRFGNGAAERHFEGPHSSVSGNGQDIVRS